MADKWKKWKYSVKNYDKNKLLKWNLLANEELIALTYVGDGIQGCKYISHTKKHRSDIKYIMHCKILLKHPTFHQLFHGKETKEL